MSRPMQVQRVGPPAATLHRRLSAAGLPGSLAMLVEVWGMDEPRQRQAVERRLAEGMANIFERREGGVTTRLRLAVKAGDRWLRRVRASAGPGEDYSGLGAGASLLWCSAGEAILAQVGPSVAFALDLPEEAERVEPVDLPEALRHPAASPWLRRGLTALAPDALWPPMGMGDPQRLEVHWAHWPFPPGAAALLAPSVAADVLRRDAVGRILGEAPELAARRFDEILPEGLPALLVRHPRPPDLAPPPEPEEALDLTARFDALGWETAAQPALPEPAPAEAGPPSADLAASEPADTGDGDPQPLPGVAPDGQAVPLPAVGRGGPIGRDGAGPCSDAKATVAAAPASEPAVPAATASPPPAAWSPRADAAVLAAALMLGLRRLVVRMARGSARVIVALLPQRAREGADSYAVETARLAAAAALALPALALLLTWMMLLRGPAPAGGAPGPEDAPAVGAELPDPAEADPPELGIRRLALQPAAGLPGEPGDDRRLVLAGGWAWVLDRQANRIDRVALAPAEGGVLADPAPVEALAQGRSVGETVVGALEDLFLLPPPAEGPDGGARARVVALDAAGRLWALDSEGVAPLPRPEQPGWVSVTSAAGFEGRLYALDRSTGQIYRYTATGGSWPAFGADGEPWLSETLDLAGAIDLAIDGAVYVLREDRRILKLGGGQAVAFDPSGIPDGLQEPVALHALPPEGDLLVADRGGRRVLVLGPDGAFRAQLLKPAQSIAGDDGGLDQLQDLWWDENAAMLYVLADGTLWMGPFAGP